MRIEKIILVSSGSHPLNKVFTEITKELSTELNVPSEVKEEDYVFLTDYGEKEEDLGTTWLPQLFIVLEGNKVYPVLTKPILDQSLKPDKSKMKEEAMTKIKKLSESTQ